MLAPRAAIQRFRSLATVAFVPQNASSVVNFIPKRPSIAPKPQLDIRHIRQNPDLYNKSCIDRNYSDRKAITQRIIALSGEWKELQVKARVPREQYNDIMAKLDLVREQEASKEAIREERASLLREAAELKPILAKAKAEDAEREAQIQVLAEELPNLISHNTPIGKVPRYLDCTPYSSPVYTPRDHVFIGKHLDLLDFAGAATTSGWGWYFLKNEAALMEQALVNYALEVAMKHGFNVVQPPSMVYSHIASACGFRPRDQGGEHHSYTISQVKNQEAVEKGHEGKPEMTMAGTAEIPFAGMKANTIMEDTELPLQIVGSSRCFRAEAGARGTDTKGLYRVHEFTKVEMFTWTSKRMVVPAFDSMLAVQKEILENLGLHFRILEMPSFDLGASAYRKVDMEAYFPSRRAKDEGYGEVTSASICTDYQTRRLNTRVKLSASDGAKTEFPYTVNGTALAVPRVLAAILENKWNEKQGTVEIPEVLHKWMHGIKIIGPKPFKPVG
ncbi:MAG: hypothetical protein Q9169_007669 [Polycauliona sp. 2 TL-2023]